MQVDARTHYYPFSRAEKYPRQLYVDFKKLKPATLRRYAEIFDVPLRPDLPPQELCIGVAKCVPRCTPLPFPMLVSPAPVPCPPQAAPSPTLPHTAHARTQHTSQAL